MIPRTGVIPAVPANPDRAVRRSRIAAALVVCVAGLWAWTAGLSGPYHFDDFATPLAVLELPYDDYPWLMTP